ncbi:MAG: hypothetical protein QS721_14520 [Candidatus Endonucleobacter sp. (ex Gigantidas childressi)]|nr:hypothetical protein [Candidatus Endonucleobacter sp. (ex Gigantidas childressi)]
MRCAQKRRRKRYKAYDSRGRIANKRNIYPSPFKLLRCWLRSLTPITYYFVGSRGFAYLLPSSNLKCSGYIRKLKK